MAQRLNSTDECGVLHFVTLNIRERKRAFARTEYAELALRELRFECERHPASLIAYVIMPDHLHFIFAPEDGKLSRFLARYKPAVTKKMAAMAMAAQREKEVEWLSAKGKNELWQDGKYSLPLHSRKWIEQKIDYIHFNPVRAGIVQEPQYYAWSSFLEYQNNGGACALFQSLGFPAI